MRPFIDLETELHYRQHQICKPHPSWPGAAVTLRVGTSLGLWFLRRCGGVDLSLDDLQAIRMRSIVTPPGPLQETEASA